MWQYDFDEVISEDGGFNNQKYFIARKAELNLINSNLASIHGIAIKVIVGLSGLGKTELCKKYISNSCQDNKCKYDFIAWLNVEKDIKDAFVAIGKKLLNVNDVPVNKTIQSVVYEELFNKFGRVLVVLDNVISFNVIKDYLPDSKHKNFSIHIILITCNASYDIWKLVDPSPILIKEFDLDESIEYLEKFIKEDKRELSKLASELCHFPLALKHAVSYILTCEVSISEYLNTYVECPNDLLNDLRVDIEKYNKPLYTSWAKSFALIEKTDKNAILILCLSSILSPENIPKDILRTSLNLNRVEFDNSLKRLRELSFVTVNTDKISLSMHRLVQVVTCLYIKKHLLVNIDYNSNIKSSLQKLINWLKPQLGNSRDVKSVEEIGYFKDHIAYLEKNMCRLMSLQLSENDAELIMELVDLMNACACYFIRINIFQISGDLLETCNKYLKILRKNTFLEKKRLQASVYLNYGWLELEKGILDEYDGKSKLEQACALREEYINESGKESTLESKKYIGICYYNYASILITHNLIHEDEKLLEKAELLLEKCTDIIELVKDNPNKFSDYKGFFANKNKSFVYFKIQTNNLLSYLHFAKKNYEKSIEYSQISIQIIENDYENELINKIDLELCQAKSFFYKNDDMTALQILNKLEKILDKRGDIYFSRRAEVYFCISKVLKNTCLENSKEYLKKCITLFESHGYEIKDILNIYYLYGILDLCKEFGLLNDSKCIAFKSQ